MNFLKDPRTNWKYILIVAILAVIVSGIILICQKWEIPKGTVWLPKKIISLDYYQNPEKYQLEFRELCNKYNGSKPPEGYQHYPELECRTTFDGGIEICKDMNPITEFSNFCKKINGQSRCYSSIWFNCIPPPNPEIESTFCRWNLWDAGNCKEIDKYQNKVCEINDECGEFPCFEGKCLIKRCETDKDCIDYYCASGTAHPHGYCVTSPGDI